LCVGHDHAVAARIAGGHGRDGVARRRLPAGRVAAPRPTRAPRRRRDLRAPRPLRRRLVHQPRLEPRRDAVLRPPPWFLRRGKRPPFIARRVFIGRLLFGVARSPTRVLRSL
jgi:hypothetical protein